MTVQLIAAFVGTIAFALIFGVPRKYYFLCGVTGAAGWVLYLICSQNGLSTAYSTFVATIAIVVLSRFFAVVSKCPVTVFLISGIIPLVPGGGIYWASYYLVTSQTDKALNSGFLAIKVAIAIVIGIVIVFELPNRLFLHRAIPEK